MKTFFYIYSCIENTNNAEPYYWNVNQSQWVSNISQASKFPKEILTVPLPPNTTHIIEFNQNFEPIKFYNVIHNP